MRFGGLIAAIVVAALAAILVLRMSDNGTAPVPAGTHPSAEVKTTSIYVAATTIPVGSVITAEMVALQPWPEHLALASFVKARADSANVVGMIARAPFQQNEPIIASKLANPNDPNFLAGDLPAGMRVVTIPLNEVDGLAGFVFPGDHVDMIYTHDITKWETSPQANAAVAAAAPQKVNVTVSETLLTNVKVLAVDQRASNAGSTDKNGALLIPRSASLMVSQADAQRVRLAQKTGTISLALRAMADRESSDPLLLTSKKDISQATEDAVGADGNDSVKVLRGAPKTFNETAATAPTLNRGAAAVSGAAPANAAAPTNPAPVAP